MNTCPRHDDQGEEVTATMRSATRELVNSHGSATWPPVRQLNRRLRRVVAMAVCGLALALPSSVALAASLTDALVPPSGFTCDVFNGCVATTGGKLINPGGPDSFTLQIALDSPLDFTGPQFCFTPTSGGVNQVTLTFTAVGASGQLIGTSGALCFVNDPTIEQGNVSIPFTIQSGTQDFAGAVGSGTLTGTFAGSVLGGSSITLDTVNSEFTVLGGGGCDPNDPTCNGGPGATPELDSILLFGTGLSGIVAYAVRRRRAGKLIK